MDKSICYGKICITSVFALKPTNLTGEDMKEWRRGWDISRKVTPLGYVGNPAGYGSVSGNMENFAEKAACLIEKRISK